MVLCRKRLPFIYYFIILIVDVYIEHVIIFYYNAAIIAVTFNYFRVRIIYIYIPTHNERVKRIK